MFPVASVLTHHSQSICLSFFFVAGVLTPHFHSICLSFFFFAGVLTRHSQFICQSFCVVLQVLKILLLPLLAIDENVFQGLNDLRELWIEFCGLVELPPLKHIRNTIRILSIAHNNIQDIPNMYLEGCRELNVLGASYNLLTSIPNLSAIAHTVTNIYIKYNTIVSTRSLHHIYFPFLHSLYLSHNYIHAINGSFLKNMPSLFFLSLEYNHLVHIPDIRVMLYDRFGQSLSVNVKDNHWNCATDMFWIWDGVDHEDHLSFDINNVTLRLFDDYRMICHSPNHTTGLSFWDISKYKTHMYVCQNMPVVLHKFIKGIKFLIWCNLNT